MKRTLVIPTILGLLWTMLLVALFVWSFLGERRHITELAENQAKAMFRQIVSARSWNSMHGGVYVPRGDSIEPNAYLPPGERVIRTETGQELVKVNPAFMTRLIADIAAAQNDVRFHLTSLAPVRPENAPDTWERESLALLEPAGERFELVPSSDGQGKFRYMAPLICEGSCVQCHASDRVGAVRGGITVSIPAGPLLSYQNDNLKKQVVAFGIIWIIGLLGLSGTSYELNRRKEMAEASNRTKSRFLANMSHDMRTPLTGILGLTERMLQRRDLEPRDARYAGLIAHSARTLLEVVNDILDCARIDSGRLDLTSRPFSPREAVDKTTSIFAFAAGEKGLDFHSAVDPDVPALLAGDAFRYRQVLANLLGNAVKFTDRGMVSLAVGARPLPHGGHMLRTVVQDTGVGIAAQDQETIFECFSQVDGSLSRRHAGSGLGLSIARQLARMMGGDITVTSQPGLGSAFVFTACFAPCADTAPESAQAGTQADDGGVAGRMSGARVLVVDDHKVNRILLSDILEEEGATPLAAASGEEALALLRGSRCALVLMDLQMPGMGGVEAIRRIRALEGELGRDKTPVIVLTAFASPGEVLDLPGDEIAAVVEKPLDVAALKRTILEALRAPGAAPHAGLAAASASASSASALSGAVAHGAPTDAPTALLDMDPALKLLSGRKDFYAMLATEFFSCAGDLRSGFADAAARGDTREAARIAHIIKTSAAALGAYQLGGMAADLERLAKDGAPVSPRHCSDLDGLFTRTLTALRQAVPTA